MERKETVVTMVVDGALAPSEVTRWLGHDIKSITTEVRDVPRHWRLGSTEYKGGNAWRFIQARTADGQWTPIGLVRYLPDDRVDVYATFNRTARMPAGSVGLNPLFWINEPGTRIDSYCQTIWDAWDNTIAS